MGTFILLSLCVFLGWTINSTIKEFEGNKFYMKLIGVIMCCLISALIAVTTLANKESVKYQTMEDYFNGKIEVIEQIDTVRIYKFN